MRRLRRITLLKKERHVEEFFLFVDGDLMIKVQMKTVKAPKNHGESGGPTTAVSNENDMNCVEITKSQHETGSVINEKQATWRKSSKESVCVIDQMEILMETK